MTDDELRDAYAVHLRTRDATDACASPEDVLALVRREGPEAHRLAVLDHVMGCAPCRREFDLLRAVEAAGQGAAQGVSQSAPEVDGQAGADRGAATVARALRPAGTTRRWSGPIGLALAASVVLAVGIRQYRGREEAVPSDVQRGTADDVTLVAPTGGSVPFGAPPRFVWHAVPHATRYEVEILGRDGAVAILGGTADTVFQPSDARRLAPGATYQWWVRAVTDDGGAPRRSAMRSFRVTPP